jgi:cysteinyl-tRNA synthetase
MTTIAVSQKTKRELLELKIKENKKSLDELISEMTLAYKKKKFLEASEKFRKKLDEKDLKLEDLNEACH